MFLRLALGGHLDMIPRGDVNRFTPILFLAQTKPLARAPLAQADHSNVLNQRFVDSYDGFSQMYLCDDRENPSTRL